MEKKDKVAITISLGALVLAIASFVNSYQVSHQEPEEDVLLRTLPLHQNYLTRIERGFGDAYPAVIPLRWKCLLVNNGSVAVTFMNSRLIQVSPEFPSDFSGQYRGLWEDEETQLNFPFSLKPGQAKSLVVCAKALVTPEIYEKFKDKFPIGSEVAHRRLLNYLAEKGVDLYGNPLKLTRFSGGELLIEYPPNIWEARQQLFLLSFETSKGKTIAVSFAEYRPFP